MATKKNNGWGGARAGAGRPPKPPDERSVPTTINLRRDALRRLRALAKAEGKSVSALGAELVQRALQYKRQGVPR